MTLFIYSPMFSVPVIDCLVYRVNGCSHCSALLQAMLHTRVHTAGTTACLPLLQIFANSLRCKNSLQSSIFLLKTNDRWKTVNQILWKYAILCSNTAK